MVSVTIEPSLGVSSPTSPGDRRMGRRAIAAGVGVIVAGIAGFVVTLHLAGVDTGALGRLRPAPLATPQAAVTPVPLPVVAAQALPVVVTIEVQTGQGEEFGTGWLFDDRADFVTNYHVVAGRASVRILDRSGTVHPAIVVGYSVPQDVAVVRSQDGFRGRPLPVLAADPPVPEPVVVLASARATGEADRIYETLDRLHQPVPVSAGTERDLPVTGVGATAYRDMMVLRDHFVYRGNSGGPVLDAYGRVLGIVTLASQSVPQAYAIPMARVLLDLESLARQAPSGR